MSARAFRKMSREPDVRRIHIEVELEILVQK